MKLLYISSSHGRGMEATLKNVDPTLNVMSIWRSGGKIVDLQTDLQMQHRQVRRFRPEAVVIHLGHNNVCYHPTKNIRPTHSVAAIDQIETLIDNVKFLIPEAREYVSELFPRAPGYGMSEEAAVCYNKLVWRIGR